MLACSNCGPTTSASGSDDHTAVPSSAPAVSPTLTPIVPSTQTSYPSSPVFEPLPWFCKLLSSNLLWSPQAPVKHQALWCSQLILSHILTCRAERMDEVWEMYAPSPVSLPAGTAPTSSTVTASTSEQPARRLAYYPPSENKSGSLITRNANRIWDVAPGLTEQQHCDRVSVFHQPSWIRRSCENCPSSLMFHAYESIRRGHW